MPAAPGTRHPPSRVGSESSFGAPSPGTAPWHRGTVAPGTQAGYTFIELLVVSTILLILASAIMPLARVTATRQREAELRRNLREIRTAIDHFKDAADLGQIGATDLKPDGEGYPPDLETLV